MSVECKNAVAVVAAVFFLCGVASAGGEATASSPAGSSANAATTRPSGWMEVGKQLADAQNAAPAGEGVAAAGAATSQPADNGRRIKMESPFPRPDYSGDLWSRGWATGDWGGLRQSLADRGLTFDIWVTQLAQGNALGGKDFGSPFQVDRQAMQKERAQRILALLDRIEAARERLDGIRDGLAHVDNSLPITLPLAREIRDLRNSGKTVNEIAQAKRLPPQVVDALLELLRQRREDLITRVEQKRLSLLAAVEGLGRLNERIRNAVASAEAAKASAEEAHHRFRYGGNVEFTLQLDTTRADLWAGGLVVLRGETQFGEFINGDVNAIMPPAYTGLLPAPNEPGLTTLSEFYILQGLSEQFAVLAGKIDLTRLGDQNEFASNEKLWFMNTAFRANPVLGTYCPYTSMGLGATIMPTKWLQIGTFLLDADGTASETGFETAFHSPNDLTVAQEWDFTVKPFGLTGHQRFGWVFSHQKFTRLKDVIPDSINRLGILSTRLPVSTQAEDWAFYYNFDQYFIQDEKDPNQGIGLFGRYGHSSGEVNPIQDFYSIGLGGKGMIPKRPKDNYGVGYYCTSLSDELPAFLGLNKEQGVELFYNIEVTPWFHITPDVQVIVDPGGSTASDAVIVYGLRATMRF